MGHHSHQIRLVQRSADWVGGAVDLGVKCRMRGSYKRG